ncbi:MAG TPA: GNAT family N-acetyltransferase [Solirubrobacterales bacterium]|nr:GNAT family N-acetyltransferase [Solirubrobacterales bacterium]
MLRRAHLNLVDSSRWFFGLDPGAAIEAGEGWLFGAGSPEHPVISNAAFRTDDSLDAGELIARAKEFFGERGRGFSIWVRGGQPEDEDLIAAAEAADLAAVYEMPEMILDSPPKREPTPQGVEVRRLSTVAEATDFLKVATASYADIGFPPEIFASYTENAGLLAPNAAVFTAYLDDEPVAIAATFASHRVAGIYWVGTLKSARGRGLARKMTAMAVEAGLELGADIASLQASPMGKPIYAAMGFETVYDYRLLMSPPP